MRYKITRYDDYIEVSIPYKQTIKTYKIDSVFEIFFSTEIIKWFHHNNYNKGVSLYFQDRNNKHIQYKKLILRMSRYTSVKLKNDDPYDLRISNLYTTINNNEILEFTVPTEKEVKDLFSMVIHNFENKIQIYNSKDTDRPLKNLKNTWTLTYDMGTAECKIKNN